MTRMVALWRCKCGTRAKVVAETGSSPSAEQMALCPKCRAPHAVHADKIISVTEEIFERSPAAVAFLILPSASSSESGQSTFQVGSREVAGHFLRNRGYTRTEKDPNFLQGDLWNLTNDWQLGYDDSACKLMFRIFFKVLNGRIGPKSSSLPGGGLCLNLIPPRNQSFLNSSRKS